MAKIKTEIKAEDLYRTNNNYFVRYYWLNGIGLKDAGVEWKTNLPYIGDVKQLNKEEIKQRLYSEMSFMALKDENEIKMDTYKEETKKVYEERLKSVQSNVNKIEEYEKLGGPLIPQGTVVYNDTGKEIKARITSYADPN